MFDSLPLPITVVAHDAGAANHIIAWVKNVGHEQLRACMRGPALKLWQHAFPGTNANGELADTLDKTGTLISGTGWASQLEWDARKMAQPSGIVSIAVLDHWTNYRARFVRDGVEILPGEIWVTDEQAKKLASSEFPHLKVVQQPNLYLDSLVNEVRRHAPLKAHHTDTHLLYVLEPIRQSWGEKVIAGEFAGLDFFIGNLAAFGLDDNLSIRLRPHPSDPMGKYDQWIHAQKGIEIALDDSPTLAASIAWSDVVVGCQTYAMVIALAAGKRVVSSIPPWAPPCILPQPGIVKLSALRPQTSHNGNIVDLNLTGDL